MRGAKLIFYIKSQSIFTICIICCCNVVNNVHACCTTAHTFVRILFTHSDGDKIVRNFKLNFFYANSCILIQISHKYVPYDQIYNKPAMDPIISCTCMRQAIIRTNNGLVNSWLYVPPGFSEFTVSAQFCLIRNQPLWCRDRSIQKKHGENCCCWSRGSLNRQAKSCHVIDYFR